MDGYLLDRERRGPHPAAGAGGIQSGRTRAGGTDNFFASRQRQRDNVIQHQGREKNLKILRSRCLNGVATTNMVIM